MTDSVYAVKRRLGGQATLVLENVTLAEALDYVNTAPTETLIEEWLAGSWQLLWSGPAEYIGVLPEGV